MHKNRGQGGVELDFKFRISIKGNVELKSVIDEVRCKREKCCASEPFIQDGAFSARESSYAGHRLFENEMNV